jgi:hypothetical protein
LSRSHIPDGDGEGTGLPDDDHQLLPSGDARIEQIAGEHGIVLRRQRDHDDRILGALTFVHGCCIGQGYFIQFPDVIGDNASLKINFDLPFLRIDLGYLPDVPVVDILLIVIDRLEYFIARRIGPAKPGDLGCGLRIQGLL